MLTKTESSLPENTTEPTRHASKSPFEKSRRLCIFTFVITAVVVTCLNVRPFATTDERFIGHADQAEIAMLAKNLLHGKGLVVDCIWLLHNDDAYPNTQFPRREGYWSIYVATVLAFFFSAFGATRQALLLCATMFQIVTSVIAYAIGCRITKRRPPGMVAGCLVLIQPSMTSVITGYSDIYLTAAITLSVFLLTLALASPRRWYWIASGISAGIAVGFKPSGLILLPVFLLTPIFLNRSAATAKGALTSIFFTLVALLPLATYNYNTDGSIWLPEYNRVNQALKAIKLDGHNAAFFDPTSIANHTASTTDNVVLSVRRLAVFLYEATRNINLTPLWLTPFIFSSFASQLKVYASSKYTCTSYENIFTAVSMILLLGGLALGAYIHVEARYWNFLIPPLTVLGVIEASRIGKGYLFSITSICVLTSILHYAKDNEYRWRRDYEVALMNDALNYLPEDAIVMTPDPWEFNFHTELPAIKLPHTDNEKAIRKISKKYRASYMVIVDQKARHPYYDDIENGELPSYLDLVHFSETLVIAKFADDTDD